MSEENKVDAENSILYHNFMIGAFVLLIPLISSLPVAIGLYLIF